MEKKTFQTILHTKNMNILLSTLIVFTQTSKQRKRGDRQTDRLIYMYTENK